MGPPALVGSCRICTAGASPDQTRFMFVCKIEGSIMALRARIACICCEVDEVLHIDFILFNETPLHMAQVALKEFLEFSWVGPSYSRVLLGGATALGSLDDNDDDDDVADADATTDDVGFSFSLIGMSARHANRETSQSLIELSPPPVTKTVSYTHLTLPTKRIV